jgi:hypothetical protein
MYLEKAKTTYNLEQIQSPWSKLASSNITTTTTTT